MAPPQKNATHFQLKWLSDVKCMVEFNELQIGRFYGEDALLPAWLVPLIVLAGEDTNGEVVTCLICVEPLQVVSAVVGHRTKLGHHRMHFFE